MRIAYQGIPGSNSEAIASVFALNLDIPNPKYLPAVHSAGVIGRLQRGEADYGVMATRNLIAGEVAETKAALDSFPHRTLDAQWLPIHHCLFVKEPGTKIARIASHIQALGQCKQTLARRYPDLPQMEVEDTAIAARYLASMADAMIKACALPRRGQAASRYGRAVPQKTRESCSG